MSFSAKIREQLVNSFRNELVEHVQTMTDGLLAIEQGALAGEARQEQLETIFRAAHSLKGAARAVGVSAVEQLAHALENILNAMQRNTITLSPELFNGCYRALDAIQTTQTAYEEGATTPPLEMLQALTALQMFIASTAASSAPPAVAAPPEPVAAPEPPTEKPLPQPAPGGDETIRVNVNKLDELMNQLSELLVAKIRAEQRLAQLRQAHILTSQWQKEWLSLRSSYSRLTQRQQEHNRKDKELLQLLDYINTSQEKLRELNNLMNILTWEYSNDTMHMALVIDALEHEIKQIRMLPFHTITGTFGRMVRDLAQAANKETVLEITGGEVELDKRLLEQIKDPLIHLLRNAIDHGIEPPDRRQARGKPRQGHIWVSAQQQGKEVLIQVIDDGGGLNLEAVRQTALRRNIPDAATMNEHTLTELIFNSGFSTSPIITDVSGRGVGLDVVRRNIEALRGSIRVHWIPEGGTTFTLTLPLTLTSSRGLLVRVSGQCFAIPLAAVERILHILPEQISLLGGYDTLQYNTRPLTLVRLSDLLGLPRTALTPAEKRLPVLVLSTGDRRMAFAVDELLGEQEVVIKGLGKQLTRIGGIAGATLMGDGEVVLILHVADLIKLAQHTEHRPVLPPAEAKAARSPRHQRHILIVDDSITTRTLEKNILEAAGYAIQIATDGQEALNTIATHGIPDLIISDVSMPRLNGFGLTQHIKSDARTARVPVILVTSLDSPEDKARGIEVGADAYIVKSQFNQNNLLETIEQLI